MKAMAEDSGNYGGRSSFRFSRRERKRLERLKNILDTPNQSEVMRRCMEVTEIVLEAEMVIVIQADGTQKQLKIR